MPIIPANLTDIPKLVALINSAYRGETSKKGWTTEANLIDGQRIDVDSLTAQISDPEAVILKNTNDEGIITGCVYLQKRADKLYLGMLTVSPTLLMAWASNYYKPRKRMRKAYLPAQSS
jgi:hypothetical protein